MVCFVVLHYLVENQTIECVESIRKTCKGEDYKIIIVENASPNESYKQVQQFVNASSDCELIVSKENLGFARGNNLGYKIARKKYNPDYIVVANNDTVIETENFVKAITEIYNETKFDVLGPDIYLQSGAKQNPMMLDLPPKEWIEKEYIGAKKNARWPLFRYAKSYIETKIRLKKNTSLDVGESSFRREKRLNEPYLYGAFYIVSKRFIENEENIFCPKTFMYHEEMIFSILNRKKGYKTIYDSSIKVLHKHSVSTKKISANKIKKFKKRNEYFRDSAKVCLEIMEENGVE